MDVGLKEQKATDNLVPCCLFMGEGGKYCVGKKYDLKFFFNFFPN